MNVSAFFLARLKFFPVQRSVVALAFMLLAIFPVRAALLIEDAITNAAAGSNLGSVAPWSNSSSQVKVAGGNLTFAGLLSPTNTGNLANLLGTAGGSSARSFAASPVTSGSVYFSFLIQTVGAPGTSGYLTGLLPGGTTSPAGSSDALAVYFSASGNGYLLGIHKGSGGSTVNAATVLTTNVTQFVVVKYTFGAGTGDDTVSLYLNPVPGSAEPVADASQAGGTDAASLQNIYLKSSSGYGAWNFDTLRVGTTWADVTPADNATNSGTAPSISLDPHDASAYVGQSAFFSVVSDGTAPLSYQWFFNTNTPVAGGTNSSLTLTNLQLTNTGAYVCIVTNSFGSDTSAVAQLTVTVPVAPTISTQPQNLTVLPGASANFNVAANGSAPLNYQWFFNTNTAVSGANNAALTVNNVQATNAGTYHVVVNNLAGSVTSSLAVLTLNNSPVAPAFVTQPASAIVLAGSTVGFSAAASGTAPIFYQWLKNGSAISAATNTALTLTNVQNSDAASYSLRASNTVGVAVSSNATLAITVASSLPNSAFNLTGFAYLTTGGGVIAETNSAYRKVTNALDFAKAIADANKTAGAVKVVEIMNDLDLGWNEVGSAVQLLASTPFRAHNPPQLHPRLLTTGVSLVDVKAKGGALTIFSANGATIRHCCLNLKSTANLIIRNLKFDEMWEWDEVGKGNYDKNDWDFIDLGNGGTVTNIWIDHCTFTKTYDGIVDIKGGSSGITISWCKYTGDDGATNPNSWVWKQITSLESNKASYAFYNFLRNNGFSTTDIVTVIQGHDKTHLIGANSLAAENANHTVTLHHEWFMNPWDRLPRLRAGNVHNYNIFADDTRGLAAKQLRDARANAMTTANKNTLNNTYSFNPFLNGSISTEGGAVLVEKSLYNDCVTPLRNNQTDPSNPTYTGKILALDTIYQFDSAYFRGNSTDPGGANTLGPVQAPIIPFSWNLPGGVLPYAYTMDDPAQLQTILSAGAGAGVVNWNKTNWLLTTYAATVPTILAQPQSVTLAPSNTANFIVVASGSAPLGYRWFFNTNTFISGATNSTLSLANVQNTNAGNYFVVITNSAGSVTSSVAVLTISTGTVLPPQVSSVVFNAGVFGFSVNGAAGQSYLVQASTNLVNWTTIFTTNPASLPFVWSDAATSNFPRRFYRIQLGP
jgi:pectate lyase